MKKIEFSPKNVLLMAFGVIELIIYVTFNALSASQPSDPIYLKYAGVLLCLAVSAAMIYLMRDSDAVVLTCAFVCTAISDLFILVLDTYYQIGLVTFIFTQTVYLYRLYKDRMDKIKYTLIVRFAVMLILLGLVDVIMETGINFMLAEVCVYIVMLAANVADAFILSRRGLNNILFGVGLALFLCCDICVGLDNAVDIIGLNLGSAGPVIQFLIWVFYLPSQVLITFSVKEGGMCPKLTGKKSVAPVICPDEEQNDGEYVQEQIDFGGAEKRNEK